MKKGELAILTCSPEYGYGEKGSPPKIPPNSKLVFEVEVFGWKGENVTDDEGVTKVQLQKGLGYQSPNEKAEMTGTSCFAVYGMATHIRPFGIF